MGNMAQGGLLGALAGPASFLIQDPTAHAAAGVAALTGAFNPDDDDDSGSSQKTATTHVDERRRKLRQRMASMQSPLASSSGSLLE